MGHTSGKHDAYESAVVNNSSQTQPGPGTQLVALLSINVDPRIQSRYHSFSLAHYRRKGPAFWAIPAQHGSEAVQAV